VGRPGEDGFTERILAAWGVDGHNSHTNICSSGAREVISCGWGLDRPSPDHANAKVILLISAHLESGHYFNPHAQPRDGRKNQRRQADRLLTQGFPTPLHTPTTTSRHTRIRSGNPVINRELFDSEQSLQSRVCAALVETGRSISRRFQVSDFKFQSNSRIGAIRIRVLKILSGIPKHLYAEYTFEFASQESGVEAKGAGRDRQTDRHAGTRFSSHNWRSATSGISHGWSVARTLFMLNSLLGAVATEGGVFPNAWNKFVPKPIYSPPHPQM